MYTLFSDRCGNVYNYNYFAYNYTKKNVLTDAAGQREEEMGEDSDVKYSHKKKHITIPYVSR